MGLRKFSLVVAFSLGLAGCITPDNSTVEGAGTPDIVECSTIPGVEDGATYEPQSAVTLGLDGRKHPDIFYIGWAELDSRIDLRFPGRGYDETRFEDKLFVSRRQTDGSFRTWQLWPALNNDCQDSEQVRIHSFDVAPDGKSLYVSMSRPELDNPSNKLAIYRLNTSSQLLERLSKDTSVDFMYPTYIGDDPQTGNEQLFIAKTVVKDELQINYRSDILLDEYDRAPTPLIHKMDVETGATTIIGFNNSHQTEPLAMKDPNGDPIVVFTQWEHQAETNRFALWKMQVDGSDSFTFFGQESATDKRQDNIFAPREIKSGPYRGYVIMNQTGRQGATGDKKFIAEGDIVMTKRNHFELRSERIALQSVVQENSTDTNISRTPEYYNDESYVYSNRQTSDNAYKLMISDFPSDQGGEPQTLEVLANSNYHFVQPRSFYPPVSGQTQVTDGDVGESRVSFTNENLNGLSGFLVQDLRESDNGVQHQLDGIAAEDLSLQFFIPSHHFGDSNTIGFKSGGSGGEMSIPVGPAIKPETDGSIGVIMKNGLYVWKVNKRFAYTDANNQPHDIWIPVRAERQEINFVPNRVNACNQCHQERDQANIDKYENYHSIAEGRMKGDLSDLINTYNDISTYNAYKTVPDFHGEIVELLQKAGLNNGQSCADCHTAKDKLNLSNKTGVEQINTTYRNLVQGAHLLDTTKRTVPYLSQSINPLGMDDSYSYAPFMWSLLLNDDLSVEPDTANGYPNASSRNLNREGDYGAVFDDEIKASIQAINSQYNHSTHWSPADIQAFITYSTTQIPVGLSDRIPESFTKSSLAINTSAAQKAYQAMVRNCFDCHNDHNAEGINAENYGLPLEKRFSDSLYLKHVNTRFVVDSHLANKHDSKYSNFTWQSNLTNSMSKTLQSARHRIDFETPDNSELLVFARGDAANANVSNAHESINVPADDLTHIENWVKGVAATNTPPTMQQPTNSIVIKEYDEPAFLDELIQWQDDDAGDISQAFIQGGSSGSHNFNDSMLALDYQSLTSAKLKTYAILGDRGDRTFDFVLSDGLQDNTNVQTIDVTVESDYVSPRPVTTMPTGYAFYTNRGTGELFKLETDGTNTRIGLIEGYSSEWTTVYRRSDKGWLYFMHQNAQRIYVVNENTATVEFTIKLDHTPNKEVPNHKQTVYLLWWRPAENEPGDEDYRAGELQAVLESKLSETMNGDFYVSLGNGEAPVSGTESVVVPEYRKKLVNGSNTVAVYVWRRATFMSQWVNGDTDSLNVLNLETGKDKSLSNFAFEAKELDGIQYPARSYDNVRAIVVAEDGAFYGVNRDLDQPTEVFMFDPVEGVQMPVTDIPQWIQTYIDDPINYGTPFLVIENQQDED